MKEFSVGQPGREQDYRDTASWTMHPHPGSVRYPSGYADRTSSGTCRRIAASTAPWSQLARTPDRSAIIVVTDAVSARHHFPPQALIPGWLVGLRSSVS